MLVLTFRPRGAIWLWLAVHPPALMFVLTFLCFTSDMSLVFAILYASPCFDAALDLQATRRGLVVVVCPSARLDVGLDLQATRRRLVVVVAYRPCARLDVGLDLEATGDGLAVIKVPTACFHVRLDFHSYQLL